MAVVMVVVRVGVTFAFQVFFLLALNLKTLAFWSLAEYDGHTDSIAWSWRHPRTQGYVEVRRAYGHLGQTLIFRNYALFNHLKLLIDLLMTSLHLSKP